MTWLLVPLLLLLAYFVRLLVLPPSNFPKNIPTIPFYVVFVPVLTDWDQEKVYQHYFRAKMEKYGAVKMYFGSRWNILVSRPEYIAQVMRNNDVFEKSGNNEKIPHAVVLEYLGDNIISAGNERWRKYRKVMTNSILFPDTLSMDGHLARLMSALDQKAQEKTAMVVPGFLQRFFLACIGDCIMGCNLDTEVAGQTILARVRLLKRQIFRPMFMTFPVLDILPIPARTRARVTVQEFKALLRRKILQERSPETALRLGPQLARAVETGDLTQKQFEDNAMISLVAGHENPEMLLASTLYMLAKHPHVQRELRAQLQLLGPDERPDLPLLNAVIFETLRMYPPIGQLVNRITRQPVRLGKDIVIPRGVYVGIHSLITQRDRGHWPDADDFLPGRWGRTEKEVMQSYTLRKSRCEITAFHGRNRACLGEKFALMEVRKCVVAILGRFRFSLDPAWRERVTPAGPIWPEGLSLLISRLADGDEEAAD
ncbi:cytochrome P450 [Metschnikowia bicuspidata var. bicuspidata NRRL YB-4993]|uniref:Cytochrome P450 n=1 Tax=Metschnikowia bicuspidata var. bicuspidata NRRL YB-4993 TaxID=869754 RepID=A0A1A0HGL5_9ASCO|nr:cytochrome P450 [Metschnikowia bicuspidata var. bicuspidata NRRL YB-4993]OBA23135.1 cytochrome P450 [Metschnikowia bicuspidata var. bicuspidata NRRL YB-4993]